MFPEETISSSFLAEAWLADTGLQKHDRSEDHYGTETDADVVLSADIGPYPAGTTLASYLSGLQFLLNAWQKIDLYVFTFLAQWEISGGYGEIPVGAEIRRLVFSADAVVFAVEQSSSSTTMDAFIVEDLGL